MTIFGWAVSVTGAVMIGAGMIVGGALVALVGSILDGLDGSVARAAGTPLSAPLPEPDPDAPTEAEELGSFDEAIRSCMAERGFGTIDDGTEGWWDAMYCDTGLGAAYRWEDAGCSGYATHVTGNDNMH